MEIKPIGYYRGPFTTKFGIPRQSGLVEGVRGQVVLTGEWAGSEALRGMEAFDYLWLIWGFSEHVEAEKHATVRPPLLGGNERMGVWATRSPFRPNNLGLSSVRINAVHAAKAIIDVQGADLMDGTPIYDIKPYLPYVDSHPEARAGFTEGRRWKRLEVVMPDDVCCQLSGKDREVLHEVLSLDPRPHYHDDDRRLYGMPYRGFDVRFRVTEGKVEVVTIVKM